MDVYFITGASKGIGYELLKQLQAKGKKVIGIARTLPVGIEGFVVADLSETEKLNAFISNLIIENKDTATSFTLVNNAGMVDPIGLIGSLEVEDITKALELNLAAPMILSNAFISQLKDFEGTKRIVNISSGAGRNAYEGWGAYCTTKAGLDHFSRVVAVEQSNVQFPVEIVAIAPGIIDTGMQETIRASEADAFPLLDQFINFKEQGLLSSAEETAQKLIAFMENEDFTAVGPIVDIREF